MQYCHVLPSNVTNNSENAYVKLCLFGLSLAELQLFTSQSYNISCLELLRTGLLQLNSQL
jgi:hypothetical protein